jgi:hypothetical protein
MDCTEPDKQFGTIFSILVIRCGLIPTTYLPPLLHGMENANRRYADLVEDVATPIHQPVVWVRFGPKLVQIRIYWYTFPQPLQTLYSAFH